jgi:hypothetical protein
MESNQNEEDAARRARQEMAKTWRKIAAEECEMAEWRCAGAKKLHPSQMNRPGPQRRILWHYEWNSWLAPNSDRETFTNGGENHKKLIWWNLSWQKKTFENPNI